MNPYVALGLVLSLIGAVGGGYWWGDHARSNASKAEKLESVNRAIEQANQLAREDAEILAAGDIKREARRAAARKLDEEIERNVQANPAYFECGLDALGLRLWNNGNAGYDSLPGQRGYGLPAAPLGEIGQARGPGQEPQASDGPVPRMQGAAPGSAGAGQPE